MSQIDLPKLDRAGKNDVLVIVETTTDTHMVTMSRHARVNPVANQTECGWDFFGVVEVPHHPLCQTVTAT